MAVVYRKIFDNSNEAMKKVGIDVIGNVYDIEDEEEVMLYDQNY